VAYTWDSHGFTDLATPESESTEGSGDEIDFSSLDGIQRAVARSYVGDVEPLTTPGAPDATTYLVAAAVAEFDSDDQASSGLGPVQDAVLARSEANFPMPFDEVEVDDIGDQAHAFVATAEEDGVPYEASYLLVQDGPFLYVIGMVGIGAEANTIDTASAVVRTMIEVDPGDGDGAFDESGGSSGGLWDKFPEEGDKVVEGLTIDSDGLLYPEPAEEE
jgi:hypothetical protein